MARARAADYDEKSQIILDTAAELISASGFDRTSMASIAKSCGVSKALLYHYYPDKDSILFHIICSHLDHLIGLIESTDRGTASPIARLHGMVGKLLEAYRYSADKHQAQISNLRLLSEEHQNIVIKKERRLAQIFAEAIAEACPRFKLNPDLIMPVTMSLFSMLNWQYMWFRETGPMSRAQYAELATQMIISGVENFDRSANSLERAAE